MPEWDQTQNLRDLRQRCYHSAIRSAIMLKEKNIFRPFKPTNTRLIKSRISGFKRPKYFFLSLRIRNSIAMSGSANIENCGCRMCEHSDFTVINFMPVVSTFDKIRIFFKKYFRGNLFGILNFNFCLILNLEKS